eukprot:TRINITY_DN120595_c3_g1_i1.p1 TRINITY_DN120595_c3_g1~~TRINITY_DN120595_c3_g1_i1.p1  ORF type:complete len:361 (+),score=13.63 TRINITY_DN120595_c3_g1_i1:351-1433(+)
MVGYSDGTIGVYRSNNLERSMLLAENISSEERTPVGGIRWRPKVTMAKERLLVSAGIDGNINYWNPLSGKLVSSIKPDKENSDLFCIDYSKDCSKLAAAGRRRSIKIFDDEKRVLSNKLRPKGQVVNPGHRNRIFSVKFEDSGKTLVSASWDMTVKVWDLASGTVVRTIFGPEVAGDSLDVSGDLLLTGSHRSKDSLQLWSLSYGKLVDTIEWDPEKPSDSSLLFSAQFDQMGGRYVVACGSGRNEARLFEKRADKMYAFACGVTNLPSACSSVDYSAKQNLLAVGSCDGVCRLFERVEKGKRTEMLPDEYINAIQYCQEYFIISQVRNEYINILLASQKALCPTSRQYQVLTGTFCKTH